MNPFDAVRVGRTLAWWWLRAVAANHRSGSREIRRVYRQIRGLPVAPTFFIPRIDARAVHRLQTRGWEQQQQ